MNELGEVVDEGEEIAIGPEILDAKMSSLRSLIPSRIVKVNNIFNRDIEMTAEVYEELREDFESEMHDIPQLRNVKVVRNGEEKLGAEVGSIFIEFKDVKGAIIAVKRIKGRIYDGSEIKCAYIDEQLYQEFFPTIKP